ncbi:MAG TPA: hypothetical protein G4N96_06830, partial [Chloroflexi bacterium]|nr:hypothetical protein [Chloroflexota bacterium]
ELPTEPARAEDDLDWKTVATLGAGAALLTKAEPETPLEPVETEVEAIEIEAPVEIETDGEVIIWLTEAQEVETEAEEEAASPVETAEVKESPDWLTAEPDARKTDIEMDIEALTELSAEDAESPDWLTGLQTEIEAESLEIEEAPIPDWLAEEPETEADAASVDLAEPAAEDEDEGGLDWKTGAAALGAAGAVLGAALLAEKDQAEDSSKITEEVEAEVEIEAPVEAEESDESPAWLTEMEAETEVEAEAPEIETPLAVEAEAATPDWLLEVQEDAEVEIEAPVEAEESDEAPAWLAEMEAETEVEAKTPEIETPDWLPEVQEDAEIEIEAPAEAKKGDESPAWLTEMEVETEVEAEAPEIEAPLAVEAESAMSAWLIKMQAETETEAEPETKTESPFAVEVDDDILNWLSEADAESGTEVEAELPEPDAVALPEWLQADEPAEVETVAAEETEIEAPVQTEETAEAEETEIEAPAQADETAEAEEIEDESASNLATAAAIGATGAALGSMLVEDEADQVADLPDWMTSLSEGAAYGAGGVPPLSSPPHTRQMKPKEFTGEETEAAQSADTARTEAELPDWMSDLFSADEPEEEIAVDAPEQTAGVLDAPEWMLALEADDQKKEKPKPESEPSAEDREEGEDEEDPFEGEAGLALGVAGLAAGALTAISSAAPSFDLPDEAGEKPEPEDDDALDDPLDWMQDLEEDEPSAEEIAQIAAKVETPPGTASALPSWMDELPEPDFGPVEQFNAVERAVADLQDAVTVSTGARSSLGGDAALEQGVIGMDAAREFYGIVSPTAETPLDKSQATLGQTFGGKAIRAGLHLLFLALIAIPLFAHYDRGGYPYPWLEPSPIQQQDVRQELQNAIASQPPDSIALVSFDYTPSTAGEMDPLAAIVIKNLLGQGLRVIAISLEPEGQAMAGNILKEVSDKYGEQVLNLGYLPGGPVAVRRLLDDPLFGAYDIESGKSYASLDNWPEISRIDDFSLLVEIAANPDTARWWAEQLQKTQPNLHKLAAVSAAAEPFVRPYRDAGQYTALISGINGAAALESARVQKTLGPATAMLDSLSAGSLIILVLMFAGTIAGLISRYDE